MTTALMTSAWYVIDTSVSSSVTLGSLICCVITEALLQHLMLGTLMQQVRSNAADDPGQATAGNGRSTNYCTSDRDCDSVLGQTCHWLYEGCGRGQCMCQPGRYVQSSSGACLAKKLGGDRCVAGQDICYDGMHCIYDTCRCRLGTLTPDRRYCIQSRQRLIGKPCTPSVHSCFQRAVDGYTTNDVECSQDRYCSCVPGYRMEGLTCKRRAIHDHGCRDTYHCEGGAVCTDKICVCPSGYAVNSYQSKCEKRTAVTNLPLGALCDEIQETRYCVEGLVCHKCDKDSPYRCVKFMKDSEFAFLTGASVRLMPKLFLLTSALGILL